MCNNATLKIVFCDIFYHYQQIAAPICWILHLAFVWFQYYFISLFSSALSNCVNEYLTDIQVNNVAALCVPDV